MAQTHKTNGIVLRTVRYGETSLVASIFTEKFGIESYIVNGVRSAKGGSKASLYQPASLLQLEVYHHPQRNLQRIKDATRLHNTVQLFQDVVKNCVALFMVELVWQVLRHPEPNEELFAFCEDVLLELDRASPAVCANMPLFFALHLMYFFGLQLHMPAGRTNSSGGLFLDLHTGEFTHMQPGHADFLPAEDAAYTTELLSMRLPAELEGLRLTQSIRRRLLHAYIRFYNWQLPDMAPLKSLPVMEAVFG